VLVLRLDEGDYVLDNLTNEILPWNATGYAFLRIQSPSAPGNWHTGFANRS
jgi:predicted transglutaminase-like cysteine proteinase